MRCRTWVVLLAIPCLTDLAALASKVPAALSIQGMDPVLAQWDPFRLTTLTAVLNPPCPWVPAARLPADPAPAAMLACTAAQRAP